VAMDVASMSVTGRLTEILTRSKKNFGPDVGAAIDSLLSKTNLAILAGTLVLWAGSHLFGVGEIVDVLLLAIGAFTIGWSIGDVATSLFDFANLAVNGKTEPDLDKAAAAFSHAIVVAGITVIMAILLRRSVKEIELSRGANVADAMRPRSPGLPPVGNDPAAGKIWSNPSVTPDPNLSPGVGSTSPFGEVRFSVKGTLTDQALAQAHEMVHRFLTPKFGPLRAFRVKLGMAGYLRSSLLQYIEEAIAESVAQFQVKGIIFGGLKFPVQNGYMLVTDLVSEGAAIGTIMIGGSAFTVQFIPAAHDEGDSPENAARLDPK
jgi:hypothetical protein